MSWLRTAHCEVCGTPFDYAPQNRPGRFCSNTCKGLAMRQDGELTALPDSTVEHEIAFQIWLHEHRDDRCACGCGARLIRTRYQFHNNRPLPRYLKNHHRRKR